jgi:DNA-cytosine methyltransferase
VKVARLFSGFDGAGEGIRAAGFDLSWAIEYDPKIAAVAQMNGHNVIVANILDVDPRSLERPDIIHASPVCTNASIANANGEETQLDRDTAMKTVQFVEVLRPRVFTLENVWQYRNFQAFAGGDKCEGIFPELKRMGYKISYWHINSADYSVPQTRKRLILVAALDFYPDRPPETHYNPKYPELAHPSLFSPARLPWVGWYEAIEDLIQTLPDSQFAPWQLERLPDELKTMLIGNDRNGDARDIINLSKIDNPAFTITSSNGSKLRAFLVHPTDQRTMPVVDQEEPIFTVMSGSDRFFSPRAFIIDRQNARPNGVPFNRVEKEPAMTVTASTHKGYSSAWLSSGRVVKMTPRALARFQTFPDSYKLSGNNALDCKGIGNACPPKLFEAIYRQIKMQMESMK